MQGYPRSQNSKRIRNRKPLAQESWENVPKSVKMLSGGKKRKKERRTITCEAVTNPLKKLE